MRQRKVNIVIILPWARIHQDKTNHRPMRPLSYLSPKQYLEQYKNKKLKLIFSDVCLSCKCRNSKIRIHFLR